jgi:SAM-dependent methyltransferase
MLHRRPRRSAAAGAGVAAAPSDDGARAAPTAAEWLQTQAQLSSPLFDVRRRPTPAILGATRFHGLDGHDPNSLTSRLHELPPPEARTRTIAAVIADARGGDEAAAAAALRLSGYRGVVCLTAADIGEHAPGLMAGAGGGELPLSRALWSPSPTLRALLPTVSPGASALDVGCGSGRDAAYLACHGWDVLAVDRDPGLVAKAELLGNRGDQGGFTAAGVRRGRVRGSVRTLGADLREDEAWLRGNAADLLVVVRFLRRGVLELLPCAVKGAGFVVVEHFLTGCEAFGGPMKRSQMLDRGELGRLFGGAGFVVHVEEEVKLADGRPVVRFLAQRASAP